MSLDFVKRAEQLAAAERWQEVAAMLEPVVENARSAGLWSMLAMARLHTGRRAAAADALWRAAVLDGEGGRAWLNAATVLSQEGRMIEALDAARRAIALGFAPPEAYFLLGRALQGTGDFSAAEIAFQAAVEARSTFAAAHRELAQLVWMRTGDCARARQALDAAIAAHPTEVPLWTERARLLNAAGDEAGGKATTAQLLERVPPGPQRRLLEAHEANLRGDFEAAAKVARDAVRLGAEQGQVLEALATAQLGQGDGSGLLATAEDWLRLDALNQLALAYRGTALRMLDDPRGEPFRDYEKLVRVFDIDLPDGCVSLDAYLTDLAAALAPMHPFEAHPVGQSVRSGSQTMQSLAQVPNPAVRAFFQAIDGPIRRYMAHLGSGNDPLRARNSGAYEVQGCWSVWLKPGGFHIDHVHPRGWISSACYIATPKAAEDGERKEGWIRFGQPRVQPPGGLPAEHFVQPLPGRLVLFPAWMWHGTVPFSSEERRLTVAFDVSPA
ncbi:MAG TPA: putative 2OG-Fe(II) oxygenase [Allosphingosinicella sp.]|nr:putative 2OG-Fe(II) oxygenase [Allosphingosinicella sp.]